MKQWMKILMSCLCMAGLLAGCGSSSNAGGSTSDSSSTDSGSAADSSMETNTDTSSASFDLAKMRDDNSLQAILGAYSSLQCTDTLYQGDSTADADMSSKTVELFWVENDGLQMDLDTFDDNNSLVSSQRAYSDENGSAAMYQVAGDEKYMSIYPAMEYEGIVSNLWLPTFDDMTETVQSVETQGSQTVVTVREDYPDAEDGYVIASYTLDTASNLIDTVESVGYNADDTIAYREVMTVVLDGAYTPEVDAYSEISGGSNYCELNVIFAPQQENMEVQWYPVAHDTHVYVVSMAEEDYKLYSDEELTKELSDTDEIDVSGEAANVFVVFQNN